MNQKTFPILLAVVIVLMLGLLVMNSLPYLVTSQDKFISPNQVTGMAVVKEDKPYTLNFDQQTKVIDILNRSVKVPLETHLEVKENSFPFDQLIIYRSDKPELILKPFGLINNQLLFQIKEWNPDGLLRETGPGELEPVLTEALKNSKQ